MPPSIFYLLVDICCIAVPLIASFHPKIQFYRTWPALLPAIGLSGALFILWDILFTHWGVWGFNRQYLIGVYAGNLPIEEILFFICIPYASVFTYYCIKRFLPSRSLPQCSAYAITWLLLGIAAALAITAYDRLYTSWSNGLLCLLLLYHVLNRPRAIYLPHFYLSFLILLIPFAISNGILTGSLTEQPIVWYNDAENLGLRIFTIPVEDVGYALLLLLLNVTLFERLLAASEKSVPA